MDQVAPQGTTTPSKTMQRPDVDQASERREHGESSREESGHRAERGECNIESSHTSEKTISGSCEAYNEHAWLVNIERGLQLARKAASATLDASEDGLASGGAGSEVYTTKHEMATTENSSVSTSDEDFKSIAESVSNAIGSTEGSEAQTHDAPTTDVLSRVRVGRTMTEMRDLHLRAGFPDESYRATIREMLCGDAMGRMFGPKMHERLSSFCESAHEYCGVDHTDCAGCERRRRSGERHARWVLSGRVAAVFGRHKRKKEVASLAETETTIEESAVPETRTTRTKKAAALSPESSTAAKTAASSEQGSNEASDDLKGRYVSPSCSKSVKESEEKDENVPLTPAGLVPISDTVPLLSCKIQSKDLGSAPGAEGKAGPQDSSTRKTTGKACGRKRLRVEEDVEEEDGSGGGDSMRVVRPRIE